jgi:hypothetical protein
MGNISDPTLEGMIKVLLSTITEGNVNASIVTFRLKCIESKLDDVLEPPVAPNLSEQFKGGANAL